MTGTYTVLFIIAFLLLIRAGSLLVMSLTRVSRFFGLSEYVVAFVFMSFATSIPELAIGLSSAAQGIPGLSFGNIIGANAINVTLAVGLAAFFADGLKITSRISRANIGIIFLLSVLPFVLAFDGVISRGDGLVLVGVFVSYLVRLMGDRAYFSKQLNALPLSRATLTTSFRSLLNVVGGVLLLIISAAIVTFSGSNLARSLGIANATFGILFLAVSTALPEIVFGIRARMLDHADMAIGNTLGSVAFNAAGIVGVVALLNPITVVFDAVMAASASFFIFAFVLFISFVYTRNTLSRKEAAVLIGAYLAFALTLARIIWN